MHLENYNNLISAGETRMRSSEKSNSRKNQSNTNKNQTSTLTPTQKPDSIQKDKKNTGTTFDQTCENIVNDMLQFDPVSATYLGQHQYDHLLTDPSTKSIIARQAQLDNSVTSLDKFESNTLSKEQILDRELLRWQKDLSDISINKAKRHLTGGFPVEGFLGAINILYTRNFAPLKERINSIIKRLLKAETYLNSAKENFKNPVIIFVEDEIYASTSGAEFIKSISESVRDKVSDSTLDKLKKASTKAINALKKFSTWLTKEIKPKATMNYQFGRECFDLHIETRRFGLDTSEIRELGRQEFKRLNIEIDSEIGKLGFSSIDEATIETSKDVPDGFPNILTAYKKAIELSKKQVVETGFATLPTDEILNIEQTPEFLERTIPSAAYEPPEVFSKAPYEGMYLVTRPLSAEHLKEHNLSSILNVSFHEAYPGHHLQSVYASQVKSPIRKITNGIEFIEGWAHYCEEEMYLLTVGKDESQTTKEGKDSLNKPESRTGNGRFLRLAQLLDARYRALRIELDIGLHYGDINYEEAQEMMISQLGVSKETAEAEVGWYCREPGYALSYLLGKILFKKLRKDCEKQDGATFSMKEFHDKVLKAGGLPIWAMREVLNI